MPRKGRPRPSEPGFADQDRPKRIKRNQRATNPELCKEDTEDKGNRLQYGSNLEALDDHTLEEASKMDGEHSPIDRHLISVGVDEYVVGFKGATIQSFHA